MESKLKHLELIQSVINRMAQNSFLIKGWTITLASALFALAAKDAKPYFIQMAYIPVIMFWLLDTYFLYQERLFRNVYDSVRLDTEDTKFSMSTNNFDKGVISYWEAITRIPQLLFYGCMIIAVILVKQNLPTTP